MLAHRDRVDTIQMQSMEESARFDQISRKADYDYITDSRKRRFEAMLQTQKQPEPGPLLASESNDLPHCLNPASNHQPDRCIPIIDKWSAVRNNLQSPLQGSHYNHRDAGSITGNNHSSSHKRRSRHVNSVVDLNFETPDAYWRGTTTTGNSHDWQDRDTTASGHTTVSQMSHHNHRDAQAGNIAGNNYWHSSNHSRHADSVVNLNFKLPEETPDTQAQDYHWQDEDDWRQDASGYYASVSQNSNHSYNTDFGNQTRNRRQSRSRSQSR